MGGVRTHDPKVAMQTPYPLGHRSPQCDTKYHSIKSGIWLPTGRKREGDKVYQLQQSGCQLTKIFNTVIPAF